MFALLMKTFMADKNVRPPIKNISVSAVKLALSEVEEGAGPAGNH